MSSSGGSILHYRGVVRKHHIIVAGVGADGSRVGSRCADSTERREVGRGTDSALRREFV